MDLRNQARKSFSWSILNQLSNQIVGFIVSIILARILFPKDFGVIGMITIFITLSRTLLDGGLASSLIRNKDVTQADYSTVFFTNIVAAILLYVLLFFTAPLIACFFGEPIFVNLLRVYGIVLLMGSLSIIQSVRLKKNLDFKTQFVLLIPSLIISAIVSIWMAYNGFGVWSLVWKEIIFSGVASVQLWIYAKWRPSFVFDKKLFKYHFIFGSKLLLTDILSKFFNEVYKIVIGKYFSATQLGLFTRAKSMEELPNGIIFNSINRVMYPLLSNVNDDDERLKRIYRQIITTVHYLVVPILVLIAILAKHLFVFLLTEKWIEAVPYFQILIIAALLSPMQQYMLNICKVKGRSDLVLKLSTIQYISLAVGLLPAIWFGIFGLLWSIVAVTAVMVVITARFAGRLIGYTIKEQILDIYQPYLLSIISAIVLLFSNYIFLFNLPNNFILLTIGILIFMFIYLFLSYLSKNTVLMSGVLLIKNKISRTNPRK